MAQLQHNMWVMTARSSVLPIITSAGKWVELRIHADPFYQHLLLTGRNSGAASKPANRRPFRTANSLAKLTESGSQIGFVGKSNSLPERGMRTPAEFRETTDIEQLARRAVRA